MFEDASEKALLLITSYKSPIRKIGTPIGRGNTWKYFKEGLDEQNICNKCKKEIDFGEPCYSKSVGSKHKHTVHYCENCYRGLWL